METFGSLKRRTTDLMSQAQGQVGNIPRPNLPGMPAMPSMPTNFPNLSDLSSRLPKMPNFAGAAHPGSPTQKATWERIDVPPMPRSSHSINVVAGSAYIFGGEIRPREPVDNDMHVITLPFSSAGADYYAVKPKAAPKQEVPQVPTVIAPSDDGHDDGKEKDLAEVPLGAAAEGSEDIQDGAEPSSSKGKGPAAQGDIDRSSLGDVPCPRVGHATAVIGNRIFLFGGRGGPDMAPLEEHGRVWVFDTKTHLWSYLDPLLPAAGPVSPAFADKRHFYPAARSYHSAAGADQPRDFATRRDNAEAAKTWAEWAQDAGPAVGQVANNSRDEDDDGYGTVIVHGGCLAEGRAGDTWAFDVRSRVWQELPTAPGKPRGGVSLAVAGSRLWRFGGFDGEAEVGGQLDYLELGVDSFENVGSGRDVVLSARGGGWKSVFPELADSPAAPLVAAAEESAAAGEDKDETAAVPLKAEAAPNPHWPGNRSVAGMQTVTIGGVAGREYLILLLGERDPSDNGHEAAGKFWGDIWAYELPRAATAASAASSVVGSFFSRGRSASKGQERPVEGKWFRVETEAYDDEDGAAAAEGPGPRGWFATAHMGELEERGIVVWGGLDGANKRLGDGWILRLGAEKREA